MASSIYRNAAPPFPASTPSENRNRPRRAPHPPPNMQRRTRQKETPPPPLLTHPPQRLQIPHLPNRRPPLHKQPLMQTPSAFQIRRPGLERHAVAPDGREMVGVEPAHGCFGGLEADAEGGFLGAGAPLRGGGGVVPADVAGAEEEDVPGVGGGVLVGEGF